MTTSPSSNGPAHPPNPFFQKMEAVFRAIKADDGDGATALLRDAGDALPETTRDYLYPWYCLLAARAADLLRKRVGNVDIFFPDKGIDDAFGVLDFARRMEARLEAHTTPTPLSTEVIRFLKDARTRFVEDCKYVIDWKNYVKPEDEGSPWLRLQEISETDKNHDACWSIYSDLNLLLSAGRHSWVNVIAAINDVELGKEAL